MPREPWYRQHSKEFQHATFQPFLFVFCAGSRVEAAAIMAKDDKRIIDEFGDVPHERKDPRPDFSTPPPRKQLPKELQDTLNDEEKLWEVLYEGKAEDTTDTSIRYAAYASRIRTIMLSAHRYVAYTSDIGESFRPIAHPYLVKGAYGVSWLYLIGDVSHEGYKAYCRNQRTLHPENYIDVEEKEKGPQLVGTANKGIFDTVKEAAQNATNTASVKMGVQPGALTGDHITPGLVPAIEDYRAVMAQRAIFQAVASMGLPAFTIHSIVRYSGRALKDAKNKTLRTWGPIGVSELTC
jgi:fission process protein 1